MATVNVRELLHEQQALRVQKEALGKEGLAVMDAASSEKRSLTADEKKRIGEIETQVDGINSRLAQLETEISQRQKFAPEAAKPDPAIGLSEREARTYSFVRMINALANPTDRRAQEAAAFEREASEATAKALGLTPQGFLVPTDVLRQRSLARVLTPRGWQYQAAEKRDLVKGTTTAGGYMVATDLLADSFIEMLRNRMMVQVAGATILGDLQGDVAIPKQSAGATAYWVAENGAPTESQQTVAQVTMSPKTVGAFTDISRKLLKQSSIDVEGFVRRDLSAITALAVDLAALHGSGSSNQPTGIAATSGIGSVAGGTNGSAPTLAHIVQLETEVAIDNADIGTLAYMTNAKVRGKLKQTAINATYGDKMIWADGDTPLNGYPAYVTNQVSSTLTKGTSSGVCSAIFFGNWADLMIGMWGTLDILVDPYTGGTAGTVRVIALNDIDIAVRNAESFAAMLDALTA